MAGWEWMWWVGGGLAAGAGVWLLYRAMLWDRARGRRRCPGCWYDMAGLVGLRCPECGRVARRERTLRRTRRRWWWGCVGVVLVVAGLSGMYAPTAIRLGWPGAVPTWVLVWATRLHGVPDDWASVALRDRYSTSKHEPPSWLSRVAMASYGRRLLRNAPRVEEDWRAGLVTLPMPMGREPDQWFALDLLGLAGAEARESFASVVHIWREDGEQLPRTGWHARDAAIMIAIDDANRTRLLSRLLDSRESPLIRKVAAEALDTPALDNGTAMQLLGPAARDTDSGVRTAALRAIARRPNLSAFGEQIRGIVETCSLAEFGDFVSSLPLPANIALVCELALLPDPRLREISLRRLTGKDARPVACMELVMNIAEFDRYEQCRARAALVIGCNGTGAPGEREVLRTIIWHDGSELVRAAAVEAGMIGTKIQDADALGIRALADGDNSVRIAAMRLLARFARDPGAAIGKVRELGADPSKDVRETAARAVEELEARVKSAAEGPAKR
jgi:hypothetical protein